MRLALLLAAISLAGPAAAASFDCTRAATADERAICANPILSTLDILVNRAYAEVRKGVGGAPDAEDRAKALDDARLFDARKARCGADVACLVSAHAGALADFQVLGSTAELPPSLAATELIGGIPRETKALPAREGECARTRVTEIGGRLDGDTDFSTGTSVFLSDGGRQVSYDKVAAIIGSRRGDPVLVCLTSIPKHCPPDDDRGRFYTAINLRTPGHGRCWIRSTCAAAREPACLDPCLGFGPWNPMLLRTRAPAKINLTLHVVRRRTDGFHDLESLVIFAGVADILTLDPGEPLGLAVSGPTSAASGETDGNLVLKAARALAERVPGLRLGGFRLTKRLPVGAGIGGGSSDAAAALRLLAELNGLAIDDDRLHEAARATGSDVPVCVDPRSRMMAGTGDRLGAPLMGRPLYAVLANPGIHVPTPAVFARMGFERGETRDLGEHPLPHDGLSHAEFLALVKGGRNDMEAAALSLAPAIGDAIDVLSATAGPRVVRMSGSGSTCFALYDDRRRAAAAAKLLAGARPDWWIRATALR